MTLTSFGNKLANVFNWLVTPELSFDFSQSDQIYFGNGRIVSREELVERCLSHASSGNVLYEMGDQGFCIHCDPRFHEFLLNRPSKSLIESDQRALEP